MPIWDYSAIEHVGHHARVRHFGGDESTASAVEADHNLIGSIVMGIERASK